MSEPTRAKLGRAIGVGALAVLLLSGCKADVTVAVGAERTGGGEVRVAVRLDRAALDYLGGIDALALSDLAASGWSVSHSRAGDVTVVSAVKAFASASGFDVIVRDLTGDNGPLSTLRLEQQRSFVTTRTRLRGAIDLRRGLAAFGDERLRALTGSAVGFDESNLGRRLPAPLADSVSLTVSADLPGVGASGGPQAWEARLGQRVAIDARATSVDRLEAGALAMTVLSAVGLFVFLVVRGRGA